MANTLNFKIEGVKGELQFVPAMLVDSQKLYQDGTEVKRKRQFSSNTFYVMNDEGAAEEIKFKKGLDFTWKAEFRGQKIPLEKKLTALEYILGLIPLALIFLGGMIGAIGTSVIYSYIRRTNNIFKQILIALAVSVVCFVVYYVAASYALRFIHSLFH